jgi:hypothetical protein
VSLHTVVWLPNALILTAILGVFAWWRWRRRGALIGMRWVGVAMLPLALYGIGLFRLAWTVGLAFSRFVTGFVWRSSVWLGLMLALIAVILIILPTKVQGRSATDEAPATRGRRGGRPRSIGATRSGTPADGDMAEIEDILKRHGIG